MDGVLWHLTAYRLQMCGYDTDLLHTINSNGRSLVNQLSHAYQERWVVRDLQSSHTLESANEETRNVTSSTQTLTPLLDLVGSSVNFLLLVRRFAFSNPPGGLLRVIVGHICSEIDRQRILDTGGQLEFRLERLADDIIVGWNIAQNIIIQYHSSLSLYE